ncbi:tRNA-Thr(GGU) m(6)t(6)A37 methyltransferase TsaA [Leptospira fainei serovar Hurstbridge str. BUT 6]|uniref:tRNA-Thr(GGU) m(6)t(6)A37 methyltransferase TsaA n=1 Tax=Leptospira fainei serovar Hurstbridge str. BUT 6 TaxID=1193011 RepID=S3UWF0_9LEPT|nr:tRNA (N6-threonylcarbamoyladenosine(37)-N6)-methyltransferase TrmO [Leptospira fainei]EPG74726.1 tRNA-Thr(GGU) m(6)t(6)A37 methyltransferase TsaA [Leptospira fainei serovar Hurstbridge str. BUT 6]
MSEFKILPIGTVHCSRSEVIDDDWDKEESYIELSHEIPVESLEGLKDFSHIEVFYIFDKVDPNTIVYKSERPRENPDWPKIGIFAQRKKARPNRIGATIVELLRIDGRKIFVKSLDAIDGTPVIDIKPVFKEYLPRQNVVQPRWSEELMRDYWTH